MQNNSVSSRTRASPRKSASHCYVSALQVEKKDDDDITLSLDLSPLNKLQWCEVILESDLRQGVFANPVQWIISLSTCKVHGWRVQV